MLTRFLSILIALVATVPALSQVEDMERAIETAARNFRIQTYETYRTNRPVYDQRIEASNEALKRFRLAADDVGRIEMQQWFFQAGSMEGAALPEIPEIQLTEYSERPRRSAAYGRAQPVGRRKERTTSLQNGFVVEKYESNPRFDARRRNAAAKQGSNGQSVSQTKGDDTAITKALKNPGELFGNIGKSFLRGNKDGNDDDGNVANSTSEEDAYPFAEDNEETTMIGDDDMRNALDDIIASDDGGTDFDELNNRIVGQNLAIGLLVEDFRGDDLKSIEFIGQCVDRLENLNLTQMEINEQRNIFADDQKNELTSVNSLEEITSELMTAVNESAKQLAAGEIEDEEGTLATTIGDLRMRLSEILAEQSF